MYYDKRIRYLSYYESDIKLQNAGYVKFQVRDSLCQMIINVKGPRLMGSGETAVYLLSRKCKKADEDSFYVGGRDSGLEKHLLGNLNIRGGQGHCAVRMNAENMADSGLRYDEICGIRIELHEYQYLESQWGVVNFMPEKRQPQGYRLREEQKDTRWEERGGEEDSADAPVEVSLIVEPVSESARVEKLEHEKEAGEKEGSALADNAGETQSVPCGEESACEPEPVECEDGRLRDIIITEDRVENISDDEDSMQGMLEREIRKEECEAAEAAETGEPGENREAEGMEEEIRAQASDAELQPDKWEQLRATYPIVHPIREEEEYLKITPRDFVIFTEKYQELVHNSFLLHGYYNYKHLILGKKERDGKTVYYLGVPGTFHDREKSVAVMFGFEAFDGKREPAEKGDFGYYLRRVEI